ncbi:hypothetical protein ZWY2020_046810 [Hordeum vulgare]|nr:hypothetical protein ZWY2020_046810 [Hordeum vulgare]
MWSWFPRRTVQSVCVLTSSTSLGPGEYEEVLGRLSSLITQKVRAHTSNRGPSPPPCSSSSCASHGFACLIRMDLVLQILELEEPITRMKLIHSATLSSSLHINAAKFVCLSVFCEMCSHIVA